MNEYFKNIKGDVFFLQKEDQAVEKLNLKAMTAEEVEVHLNGKSPSIKDILESVKAEVRVLRDKILGRVSDIGAAAFATGNTALANEVFADKYGVRRKLLDITDDTALNTATTREDMEASVLAYYSDIVGGVSQELRGAFKELEK